jgi:hypothetical protein
MVRFSHIDIIKANGSAWWHFSVFNEGKTASMVLSNGQPKYPKMNKNPRVNNPRSLIESQVAAWYLSFVVDSEEDEICLPAEWKVVASDMLQSLKTASTWTNFFDNLRPGNFKNFCARFKPEDEHSDPAPASPEIIYLIEDGEEPEHSNPAPASPEIIYFGADGATWGPIWVPALGRYRGSPFGRKC